MSKLSAFVFTTLDGYFEGPEKGDISWHRHGPEENAYAVEALKAGSTLLFGRVTYQMMAGYWPTPAGLRDDPVMAEGMNKADKIVFSRTLDKADWRNARLVKGDIADEVRRLKQTLGKDITLLGSGSILTQFAEKGLIDNYEIMVDPVILGGGTPVFNGLKTRLDLRLTSTRAFRSGTVLLSYAPLVKA
jgi:dihydrofolate reductase